MDDAVTPFRTAPEVDATPGVAPEPAYGNGRLGSQDPERDPGVVPGRDRFRGVLFVLLALAVAGAIVGLHFGRLIYLKTLMDAVVTLGLFAGMLIGALAAQAARSPTPTLPEVLPAPPDEPRVGRVARWSSQLRGGFRTLPRRAGGWFRAPATLRIVQYALAIGGIVAIVMVLRYPEFARPINPRVTSLLAGGCLLVAALAATAARYLAELDAARLPEASGLSRAARTTAWILILTTVSVGLRYWAQDPRFGPSLLPVLRGMHFTLVAINAVICVNLLLARRPRGGAPRFPTDLAVLSVLGSRWNVLGSVLDAGERGLGIDLRSTWAVTVVRQSLEPLAICLVVFGWLSTSLTVVGVQEEGLIERLGVPVQGEPLGSGLHLHLPWPIDKVYRIPTLRVQTLAIGNEEEAKDGPEDVLWSVLHVQNEFTLLLGDGRDLITIDGAVQFRIVDSRAWRYSSQNPAVALRALAYRAVMRNTVNLTLSDALSENMVQLTDRMRKMVQEEADKMNLGVQIVAMTMSGMHPPVAVATAYEGVVSAQIKGVTAVVDAQAFRNGALPGAEASVLNRSTAARAQGAEDLARAAGEAWSFRTLLSQYRAAPTEYQFRRKLETLEQSLTGKKFTVVDSRFTRDGGELWIEP